MHKLHLIQNGLIFTNIKMVNPKVLTQKDTFSPQQNALHISNYSVEVHSVTEYI